MDECTFLERTQGSNPLEGSNPSPSAIKILKVWKKVGDTPGRVSAPISNVGSKRGLEDREEHDPNAKEEKN